MEDVTKRPLNDLQKPGVMANENTPHLNKLNENVPHEKMKDNSKKWSWKFWKPTYHVCGSHHNHTSEEDMVACNKVLAFQLEQEEKVRRERQKLAEMDKMIEFSAKRQGHLVRKNEKLQELRHQGIDLQNPEDLKKVNEAIEAINEGK